MNDGNFSFHQINNLSMIITVNIDSQKSQAAAEDNCNWFVSRVLLHRGQAAGMQVLLQVGILQAQEEYSDYRRSGAEGEGAERRDWQVQAAGRRAQTAAEEI